MSASTVSSDHARLIIQLELIADLTESEREQLRALPLRLRKVAARTDIVSEGDQAVETCLILDGLVCRYKTTGEGARQILSFHFPGDLPDLQSLYLECMDHGIASITSTRVAFIPHQALRSLAAREPGIAAALAKHALVDASIFREWILNVGQRQATERIAHLFCEFYVRARLLDSGAEQDSILLPFTQAELGDATGLSVVHVNRVLQKIRGQGLIENKGHNYTVTDWPGLQRAGDFNARYLHLKATPHGLVF